MVKSASSKAKASSSNGTSANGTSATVNDRETSIPETASSMKASSSSKRKKRDSGHVPASSDDDDEPPKQRKSATKSGKKAKVEASDSEALTDLGDLEKDEEKPLAKASKGKGRAKKIKTEDQDDDGSGTKPATAAGATTKKRKRISKKDQTHLPECTYPPRNWESKKFIGAHVSISGGAHYAPHRALMLGGKAFGLFTKTQKAWKGPPLTEASLRLFPMRCGGKTETEPDEDGQTELVQLGDGRGFDLSKHIVPHGSYLTNLCNPDPAKRQKSFENLLDELKRAEDLGIGLFNIHPGTSTGACTREEAIAYLAGCINDAHKVTKSIVILLENMAGSNNVVGGKFEDLGEIIAQVDDKDRIGVCYDTCHGFAQGYDMRTQETYDATLGELERLVGIKYVKAFHLNDSKEGLGKHRDLHENIGAGHLGLMAFQLLMRDPRWDGLPFILETPMISGSLKVEASPSKSSKGKSSSSGKSTIKAEDISVDIIATESQPNEQASTTTTVASAEETPLSLGGSTWRREIELLHELEKVPLGQTSAKIDMLHAEIMAIVLDTRKKDEAAKQAKKTARAALKAAKKAEKGNAGDEDEDELPSEEGEDGSMPDNDDDEEEQEEEEKPKPKRQKKTGAAKGKKGGKKAKAGCASHDEMSD